ncbi:hypothetical protein A2291_00505 [candidate division WOR-1 bacterium RIFOXYB2_FULL_42_35]|uniref:Calcineurin-like phosphoesterase domain-containing protein n=1 Tax=candidate division WOR-1 bacterium RIFOXYC2_FULL_41_25 TaxID=1802586 RepID=A0A1F4TK49_UNCSA|nr:MAG: hypothetical protein A2247_06780 [candidate division WOR-1 bacterium RIFOXYA2_FULL_41_14]OGC23454.1 MAG: hypothetical protein A2291_00505 [candidate division WOR-1 bacterium RIFOXYB2_FULL_42_35]OGC32977.1 MAG: hypothetical protein A2462_03550 [candidate division WOR-1 bacterium RIFOXYC2_FULL_41_25]OGC44099.1 MAG: hypothetical protein A2548_06495 [candidate division WOR-1 bacterium RIFOXYD2_FULL_41_8]
MRLAMALLSPLEDLKIKNLFDLGFTYNGEKFLDVDPEALIGWVGAFIADKPAFFSVQRVAEILKALADPDGSAWLLDLAINGENPLLARAANQAFCSAPEDVVYGDMKAALRNNGCKPFCLGPQSIAYLKERKIPVHPKEIAKQLLRPWLTKLEEFDRGKLKDHLFLREIRELLVFVEKERWPSLPEMQCVIVADPHAVWSVFYNQIRGVEAAHLCIAGDLFHRGQEVDHLLHALMGLPAVSVVWGDHDLLEMGAMAGSRLFICEALRLNYRYDTIQWLNRIGVDLSELRGLAQKKFGSSFKDDGGFKSAEERYLYDLQIRLMPLRALAIANVETTSWYDWQSDSLEVSSEERSLLDNLRRQYVSNAELRKFQQFLYEKGSLYAILAEQSLVLHGMVPLSQRGQLQDFAGETGLKAFMAMQEIIKRIGNFNREGQDVDGLFPGELLFMYNLTWGSDSPVFGRQRRLREAYFEPSAYHEPRSSFYEFIDNTSVMAKVCETLGFQRIIVGHEQAKANEPPVRKMADGRIWLIDPGSAAKFGGRGALLGIDHTGIHVYVDGRETGRHNF